MSPEMSSSIVEQLVPRSNVSPSMITWHKMNISIDCRTDDGQSKCQCVWEALITNVNIKKDFIFDFDLPQSFLQDACLAVALQTNELFKFERNCDVALVRRWSAKICNRKLSSRGGGYSQKTASQNPYPITTKICDFPYAIYDQTLESTPCFWPALKLFP